MTEPGKIGWRRRIRLFGNWIYSLASASLVMLATSPLYAALRIRSVLLIFIGLCVAFYFVWNWVLYERPAELEKKLPISSKEFRRRKKELYDWLAAQGRRR
jgi:hypothetical protein